MNPKDSNRIRDKIIEILDSCSGDTVNTRPLYPLLHFFEAELHEYGRALQAKVLDTEQAYQLEQEHNIDLVEQIEELKQKIEDMRPIDLQELLSEQQTDNILLRSKLEELQKELQEVYKKLRIFEDQWHPSKQELIDELMERANELEEWLTDYRDGLKKTNVYHTNQAVINEINEILGEP